MSDARPQAGWLIDPQNPNQLRYWDGERWTDSTTAAPAASGSATQPIPTHAQPAWLAAGAPTKPARPWWKHPAALVAGGAFGLLFAISAIGAAVSPAKDDAAAAGQPSTTTSTASTTSTTSTTSTPSETSSAPAATTQATAVQTPVSSPAPVAAPATSTPAAAPSTSAAAVMSPFTMPNAVGQNLQTAQDQLQILSGDPLYFSLSTDALGANRNQILDSNWKICSQVPAAGTPVTKDFAVTFDVVKLTEICP